MQTQHSNVTPIVTRDILLQRARAMVPTLAARARQAEQQRMVPIETVAEMQEAGFFRVLQSKRHGGYEMDPQTFYDVQMTLAEGCMSTAWIYGVIAVHNWQMALFDPHAAEEVWKTDSSVLIASSYMPKGKVTRVDGGYRFSGRWGYSSGIDHCQWALLGGLVPPTEAGGTPDYRTFLVPRSDFTVIDNWDTMGLCATGSKDVIVEDAFVPEHRTHRSADGFACTSPGLEFNSAPLYKLPFGQIFVRAVSSSAIGALQGALNTFIDFASVRVGDMGTKTADQAYAQIAVAEAAVAIDEMKLVLRRNFDSLLDSVKAGRPFELRDRLHYRCQASMVVDRCAHHVGKLLSASGARGIYNDYAITRHFHDINAGRSHFANNPDLFCRNYGSVLLGKDNTDFFI